MAETMLQDGQYRSAMQFFSAVPDSHPVYPFAQHSLAVAHVLAGDPMTDVTEALSNCVNFRASNKAQEECVNRSFIMFGYLFYEEAMLSKAVVALRKVPPNSIYRDDAQLGLAWTAIRSQQWGDCAAAGRELSSKSKNLLLQCEGLLVDAYAGMMQKNYMSALASLEEATRRLARYRVPSPDELSNRQWAYENTRIAYQFLAENAEDLALRAPSEYVLHQIDSLHLAQTIFKDTIDEHLKFRDIFKRESFFGRNYDKVKDDVGFAMLTVQKLLMQSSSAKEQQQLQEQQRQLDEEIKKIQDEMRRLEEQQRSRGKPPKGGSAPADSLR
jgi:hypothetical protein